MKKSVKILIIGFGSIGQRHYQNLLKLGYKNVFVYDPDKKKISKGVKTVKNLDYKTLEQFKIAFVCSPTSLHIKDAFRAAKAGCNLFIEKPLSNNLKNIKPLVGVCKKKKLVTMVGCNLRFEPCIKRIKSLVDSNYIGKIYAIYLEYGKFLPYQRPGKDYRKVYASQKKLGGGIILDDIHDFDLLFWLNKFPGVKKSSLIFAKLSRLDMDVEDIASAIFLFDNNVLGSVRCDYLQQYKHKDCRVIGEKGNLSWDFREDAVFFEHHREGSGEQTKKIFKNSDTDSNRPFVDEIKYFLNCVEKGKESFNNIETAFKVLAPIVKR